MEKREMKVQKQSVLVPMIGGELPSKAERSTE